MDECGWDYCQDMKKWDIDHVDENGEWSMKNDKWDSSGWDHGRDRGWDNGRDGGRDNGWDRGWYNGQERGWEFGWDRGWNSERDRGWDSSLRLCLWMRR